MHFLVYLYKAHQLQVKKIPAKPQKLPPLKLPGLPIKTMPVPGRKCPKCWKKGQTVWVIPGKCCPQCGTEVNRVIAIIVPLILFSGLALLVGFSSILFSIYIPLNGFPPLILYNIETFFNFSLVNIDFFKFFIMD